MSGRPSPSQALSSALNIAFPRLLKFLACVGVLYLAFMLCGWVALGPFHYKVCVGTIPLQGTGGPAWDRSITRYVSGPFHYKVCVGTIPLQGTGGPCMGPFHYKMGMTSVL